MNAPLARGDVVLVSLDPAVGGEIRKTRPAVVVSNNAACRSDSVVQVVPVTGLPERGLRLYEARVAPEPSGLQRPSRAAANQIRTVARERIHRRLGSISMDERRALDTAVAIQLGLA